jgi:superfamily II DNA helicase RecQ
VLSNTQSRFLSIVFPQVDDVSRELCNRDVDAVPYHAGKDTWQRNKILSDWKKGAMQVSMQLL